MKEFLSTLGAIWRGIGRWPKFQLAAVVAYFAFLWWFGIGFQHGLSFGHLILAGAFFVAATILWYLTRFVDFGSDSQSSTCRRCGGSGYFYDGAGEQQPCLSCGGKGAISFTRTKPALIVLALTVVVILICGYGMRAGFRRIETETPLHRAILARNVDEARRLLELGADPNAVFENAGATYTPLTLAANRAEDSDADLEISRLLLEHGARPNDLDSIGRTALIHAVVYGKMQLADLLVEKGVDPTIRDAEGNSAFNFLFISGPFNELGPDGKPPLHRFLDLIRSKGFEVPVFPGYEPQPVEGAASPASAAPAT